MVQLQFNANVVGLKFSLSGGTQRRTLPRYRSEKN